MSYWTSLLDEPTGCLSLVAGLAPDLCLRTVGCEPSEQDDSQFGAVGASGALSVSGKVGSVLWEPGGHEGIKPVIITRLSRRGAAASVSWDVNQFTLFACCRNGKGLTILEVPCDESNVDELPASLRKVALSSLAANPLLVGLEMAQQFTGMMLSDGVPPSSRQYPIVDPVNYLPVTAEELLRSDYPDTRLRSLVQGASPALRWSVVDYCVGRALEMLDDFNRQTIMRKIQIQIPLTGPLLADTRLDALVARMRKSAEQAEERPGQMGKSGAHHLSQYWALQSLVYASLLDSIVATLGSVYCSYTSRPADNKSDQEFLLNVLRRLDH